MKKGVYRMDEEAYLRDFKKHHGDFYDYSTTRFEGSEGTIQIICPVHGPFRQQANVHRAGHGCPQCANDKSRERLSDEESKKRLRRVAVENLIRRAESKAPSSIEVKCAEYLSRKGLEYEYQFVIDDHEKGVWAYDFYVASLNLLIEVDGEYYHTFKDAHNRDKIKTRLATQRGFKILRLSDNDLRFDLIESTKETIEQHTKALIESRVAHLKNRPQRKK
jgi:very-short-patch-repair endonuclease